MLSMHSEMRDRLNRRADYIDLLILISSGIMSATVFLDPKILQLLKINTDTARIIIGVGSIAIFCLSLYALKVDWKRKAEQHNQASYILARLKSECRPLVDIEPHDMQSLERQCNVCSLTLSNLPITIPEGVFHELKIHHKFKVELSKFIDQHPCCPLFLIKLILRWRSRSSLYLNKGGERSA
jgi:hypothetical protein